MADTKFISEDNERQILGLIKGKLDTKASSNHTHSDYVNQNAFSNIKVGSTTVAADSATDTVELVGSNVTLTPDETNDKVTIGITKDNVTNALGYTPPTTNTTYNDATTTVSGLMSSTDKTKLDGVETNANKTIVDSAMSDTSTNPIQNKIVKQELDKKVNYTVASGVSNVVKRDADTLGGKYEATDIDTLKSRVDNITQTLAEVQRVIQS